MKLRMKIKRFFVRYVNAAANDFAYQNFLRHTRKKTMELKYDLNELEDLYRRKEKEKRQELKKNISELQEKKDRLQHDYDEQNRKDKEALTEEYLNRRAYYNRKSEELRNDLEGLELKKMALEEEIVKLENEIAEKTDNKNQKELEKIKNKGNNKKDKESKELNNMNKNKQSEATNDKKKKKLWGKKEGKKRKFFEKAG